jgi:hypothetical protein
VYVICVDLLIFSTLYVYNNRFFRLAKSLSGFWRQAIKCTPCVWCNINDNVASCLVDILSLVHIDRRCSTIHCLWATKKKIHKTFYASMTTDNGHRRCLRSMWTRLNSMHALHSSAVITNVYCNVFKIRHYIRPFFVNVDTLCTDSLVTTRYRPL